MHRVHNVTQKRRERIMARIHSIPPMPDLKPFLKYFDGTAAAPCRAKLLGLRGYSLDMGAPGRNDLGIYDDAILRVLDDSLQLFQASTDPGRYYLDHPLNPQGCAQLKCGLWWYGLGLHRGKYPALVQNDAVTVARLDPFGRKVTEQTGWIGINIHSGGDEDDVGRFSAGCQVIKSPEGSWGSTWERFYTPLADFMKRAGQKRIPYLLVDLTPKVLPSTSA